MFHAHGGLRPALAGLVLGILVAAPAARAADGPTDRERIERLEKELAELKASVEAKAKAEAASPAAAGKPASGPATSAADASAPPKAKPWYDRIAIRGYVQFRYHELLSDDDGPWFHPADRSVALDRTFLIRRGRLILSGDVTDFLYIYIQPDLNAAPTDGDFAVQLRDLYADIALDGEKTFRIRVGQSKVPFGFVNLQSSQNRLPLERPEALNSAVEGERDIGAFLYWAPASIRKLFKSLVADGLKGSGDYGVIGLGIYSGQGLNRSDANDEVHAIARASYPIELGGQIFEPGIQGYIGRFVPRAQSIPVGPGGAGVIPSFRNGGERDERLAFSAVLYPKPIGLEVEWTIGRGPTLSRDGTEIESKSLHGGYIQPSVRLETGIGTIIPFARWQLFEGGRKFARNAPRAKLIEWDFGVELAPLTELEVTVVYTYTDERTDTSTFPYERLTDAHRLGFQVQWSF
jgi:hypothetical protein